MKLKNYKNYRKWIEKNFRRRFEHNVHCNIHFNLLITLSPNSIPVLINSNLYQVQNVVVNGLSVHFLTKPQSRTQLRSFIRRQYPVRCETAVLNQRFNKIRTYVRKNYKVLPFLAVTSSWKLFIQFRLNTELVFVQGFGFLAQEVP